MGEQSLVRGRISPDTGARPEHRFVAAFVLAAVSAAQGKGLATPAARRRAAAQDWLRQREEVLWWFDLVGWPASGYEALLRRAGMEGGNAH